MVIVIWTCMLILVIIVAFITYRVTSYYLEKRRVKEQKRIDDLRKTADGKRILEKENEERRSKFENISKAIKPIYIICYSVLTIIGIFGLWMFILDLNNGARMEEIIFKSKGYYIFSPLLVVLGVLELVKILKKEKGNKF